MLKGRSLFADRLGEEVASPLVTLVDDPTDPGAFTATETDGEGLATRRNVAHRGRRAAAVRAERLHAPGASGTVSTGSAVRGGFKSHARRRLHGHVAAARHAPPRPSWSPASATALLVQDVAGLHSGVNPVSGDFSTGAEGLRIRGGELAEPVREFTIASTLQRMLKDVDGGRRRPRVAAR